MIFTNKDMFFSLNIIVNMEFSQSGKLKKTLYIGFPTVL